MQAPCRPCRALGWRGCTPKPCPPVAPEISVLQAASGTAVMRERACTQVCAEPVLRRAGTLVGSSRPLPGSIPLQLPAGALRTPREEDRRAMEAANGGGLAAQAPEGEQKRLEQNGVLSSVLEQNGHLEEEDGLESLEDDGLEGALAREERVVVSPGAGGWQRAGGGPRRRHLRQRSQSESSVRWEPLLAPRPPRAGTPEFRPLLACLGPWGPGRRRRRRPPRSPAAQGARRPAPPLQVKFLVPNVAAGSIIGKGGVNITEIQTQSSARMQVGARSGLAGAPCTAATPCAARLQAAGACTPAVAAPRSWGDCRRHVPARAAAGHAPPNPQCCVHACPDSTPPRLRRPPPRSCRAPASSTPARPRARTASCWCRAR